MRDPKSRLMWLIEVENSQVHDFSAESRVIQTSPPCAVSGTIVLPRGCCISKDCFSIADPC